MEYEAEVLFKITFYVYSHFLSPLEPHLKTDYRSDPQKYITLKSKHKHPHAHKHP